jgi:hypothetical protein
MHFARVLGPLLGFGLLAVGSGCRKGEKTPEAAYLRFEQAVIEGDGLALYDCLDRATRTSVQSAYGDERLMRTLVTAKYPEADQARELTRLQQSEELDPAHYFARAIKDEQLPESWRRRLGSKSSALIERKESDRSTSVGRQDGTPFVFCKEGGAWGFCELEAAWKAHKERAHHAKKTVQENATLYQKAEAQ